MDDAGKNNKSPDFTERMEKYIQLMQKGRKAKTVSNNASLVGNFLSYVTEKRLGFRSDTLNDYLLEHYNEPSSFKRAGNEIVRFGTKMLGINPVNFSFIPPMRGEAKEKIVMTEEDHKVLSNYLIKQYNIQSKSKTTPVDRHTLAMLLIMSTGCRPEEACIAAGKHFQ